MTNHQIAKNNMYNKVLAFFAVPANAAIWAAFARLVTEIANFVSLKGALDLFIQQQGLDTKGVTKGKTDDFSGMAEQTVNMAYKAFVWAVDANNADLIQLFDVQISDFDRQAEEVAFAKVGNIRNAINTNVGSMGSVNLVAGDVTTLDGFITAYNASKGATGVAESHKETGTKGVAEQMHTLDSSLNLISRLLISQYSSTNAGMVSDFKFSKRIDDLPTHHSGIHVHITDGDTDNDIEGALLAIPAAGKTATSDINGIAEIIKIKNGDYHVTISAPGYPPETFKTTIVRGKVSSFSIDMSKTVGGGGISATLEGDVPSPGIADIDVSSIKGGPQTALVILVAGSALRFYASATKGGIPAPATPFLDVQPGTSVAKTAAEFIALIGLDETKKFLTVQNIGMTQGHYTLTFSGLEGK